jgi:hypothetical protein
MPRCGGLLSCVCVEMETCTPVSVMIRHDGLVVCQEMINIGCSGYGNGLLECLCFL